MRSTISVALCTHNGARFIGEQIRSILAQSRPVSEVVVSDDASTDDTLRIIEEAWDGVGPGGPTLRILRNPTPLGVTGNFEQAIMATTGDLVSLCDQDDSWAPNRVEALASEFDTRPRLGLLFTDARLINESGRALAGSLFDALEISLAELAQVRAGFALDVLLHRNLVTGATVMFRRQLVEQAMPLDHTWVHDEWLALIASVVSDVDWLPDALVDYRQHGSNQIGVKAPTLAYKIRRVLQPRGDRYSDLLTRAEHLKSRLEIVGVPANVMASIDEKIIHQQRRAGLPALRIARIVPIIREASTGRYARFSSQGNLDILRDLLQPQR
ncbi:MAG: glycosyltransferase family 2 protein [Rhodoglobus sp.]